jgi:hypothetical protein
MHHRINVTDARRLTCAARAQGRHEIYDSLISVCRFNHSRANGALPVARP